MINKRFVVTSSDLNIGDPIELDVEIIKTIPAIVNTPETRYLYPQQVQIINDCGASVEWLSVNSVEEYNEYILTPSDFTFIRLPKTFTMQDDFTSFGRCYKFIFKIITGEVATTDLTLEFINYKYSLK